MRAMPRDEGVTAETDPEPMRWTHDDAQEAHRLGWGMLYYGHKYAPYFDRTAVPTLYGTSAASTHLSSTIYVVEPATQAFVDVLATIKGYADARVYVAQKALVILSAQKLCGL